MRSTRVVSASQIRDAQGGNYRSHVQIVDFSGNFRPEFQSRICSLGLDRCGDKFNVISVLGCQSSGKSTLLNGLFGAIFVEMDSAERGEDCLAFENRAALFSLAVADTVIMNMWYHDIGRYSASNYGLLKTVLAVSLKLFPREATARTKLIFVIRDHLETHTPLNVLQARLRHDLTKIWGDIKKPAQQHDSKLSDFFDFVMFGMPSKIVQAADYEQNVIKLRDTWESFKPGSYSRGVPAGEFAMYAEQVWKLIKGSSELNVPSHTEMVAAHRAHLEAVRQRERAQLEAMRQQQMAREEAKRQEQRKRKQQLLTAAGA